LTEVSVRDTGIGIPPEDLERIFGEFEQVTDPARRHQEGTGLGLALVKRLVEMHGGAIRAESAPGRGSTFTFTIPTAP
jgi:two-component system phosphate regulon sensor histidine kinase PhoR